MWVAAPAPVLDGHGHAEVLHLRIGEDLGDVVDRPALGMPTSSSLSIQ